MSSKKLLTDEKQFFSEISELLQAGREVAYRSVNSVMVRTYWQIGKRIVEQEQHGKTRADYGEYLIINLSRHLTDHFGKGFSVANLWNFKQFYLTFTDFKQLSTHRVENLSWSHIRLIMRLDDEKERHYYLKETSSQNWSTRLLERNIKSGYYRRLLSTKRQENLSAQNEEQHLNFIKDPYVLEFLNVPEDLRGQESLLESNIIEHLQKFLLELGKGFSFVARQMRVSTETSHFYIDLVFYNYLLKCFVVIDLKTEKLTHENIGQMDMYVRMFDELKRGKDDNPTIGIILCADKDETMVKYSVLKESKQIFASKYKTVLPTERELLSFIEQENYKNLL
ncbi:PDDEXK nuclease domain-containing protein [Legionella anisa]|uniref:PDDEXK nuclease domain-containing protein n=2 Tax=Legionella TaxID=445 RepID=UPI00399CB751